jgi:hypothetical protein
VGSQPLYVLRGKLGIGLQIEGIGTVAEIQDVDASAVQSDVERRFVVAVIAPDAVTCSSLTRHFCLNHASIFLPAKTANASRLAGLGRKNVANVTGHTQPHMPDPLVRFKGAAHPLLTVGGASSRRLGACSPMIRRSLARST